MTAMISATEIMTVQDGISSDVREDGRTLLQRRPVEITCTHSTGAGARGADAEDGETGAVAELNQYSGSRVEARLGDTVVLAAATPSVVEIAAEGELESADDANEEGEAKACVSSDHSDDPRCRGQLFISIDAAPHVVDYYARALGGQSSRYRRSFLSYLAYNIRSVFGAQAVSAQEQFGGVVEAQLVSDDDDGEDGSGDDVEENKTRPDAAAGCGLDTAFPAKDLFIGKHFAFRVDVDVHVLEAGGGSVLSTVALAVHAALASCQLPSVTLHEASTGSSVSVEVDKSKPYARAVDWSQLPMLCVLHLAPTRHYVVDATPREALALPQQLHVAATGRGLVCFTRYQQWPSRKGGRLVARAEVSKASSGSGLATDSLLAGEKRARSEVATAEGEDRRPLESSESLLVHNRNVAAPAAELPLSDFFAAVSDAVHICQSMIADCHAKLGHNSEH